MIIQLEEAKAKLLELTDAVEELASAIKIDKLEAKIAELEETTSSASFWEMEGTGKILQDLKRAKDKLEEYHDLKSQTEDALMLAEMGIEENDESVVDEVLAEVAAIDSTARLGLVTGDITAATIESAAPLDSQTEGEVFIDAHYNLTAAELTLVKDAGFALEVYTVNSKNDMKALDPYITGVTTDWICG